MYSENSVVINRPIDEVFEVATCLKRCVVWRSALFKSTQTSAGAVGRGTSFKQEWQHLGVPWESEGVITVYREPYRYAYQVSSDLFSYEVGYDFKEKEEGTELTVRVTAPELSEDLKAEMPELLFETVTTGDWANELAKLKEMLEQETDMWALMD